MIFIIRLGIYWAINFFLVLSFLTVLCTELANHKQSILHTNITNRIHCDLSQLWIIVDPHFMVIKLVGLYIFIPCFSRSSSVSACVNYVSTDILLSGEAIT